MNEPSQSARSAFEWLLAKRNEVTEMLCVAFLQEVGCHPSEAEIVQRWTNDVKTECCIFIRKRDTSDDPVTADRIARAMNEAALEREALKALRHLGMELGNPALEAHGDETFADALVKYALSKIRNGDDA